MMPMPPPAAAAVVVCRVTPKLKVAILHNQRVSFSCAQRNESDLPVIVKVLNRSSAIGRHHTMVSICNQ